MRKLFITKSDTLKLPNAINVYFYRVFLNNKRLIKLPLPIKMNYSNTFNVIFLKLELYSRERYNSISNFI